MHKSTVLPTVRVLRRLLRSPSVSIIVRGVVVAVTLATATAILFALLLRSRPSRQPNPVGIGSDSFLSLPSEARRALSAAEQVEALTSKMTAEREAALFQAAPSVSPVDSNSGAPVMTASDLRVALWSAFPKAESPYVVAALQGHPLRFTGSMAVASAQQRPPGAAGAHASRRRPPPSLYGPKPVAAVARPDAKAPSAPPAVLEKAFQNQHLQRDRPAGQSRSKPVPPARRAVQPRSSAAVSQSSDVPDTAALPVQSAASSVPGEAQGQAAVASDQLQQEGSPPTSTT